jgi:STE24 endopeptidase
VAIVRVPWCRGNSVPVMAESSDRGWLAALAAAVAIAEAAVVALRPRHGVIAARPIEALAHFDAVDIERARRFGRGQLALAGAGAAAEAALLVWLVRRDRDTRSTAPSACPSRPGPSQAADPAAGAVPPVAGRGLPVTGDHAGLEEGGTGARDHASLVLVGGRGAGVSLALVLAPLPFGALMRKRALEFGLATQSWSGWAGDVARSAVLGAAFAAAGAVILAALMRHYGEDWWKAAAAGSVAVAVVVTAAGPVLLDPIFNDYTPLPEGELRREVMALAGRAGVAVGEVFEVDASRRTNAVNAYVNGLGASRRVVLYDTLLASFSAAEARSVVAHELAHVHYRDVPRLLAYLALVAPGGTRAIALLAERLQSSATPGLPALALAAGLVSGPLGVVSRQLSRAIERRADAYSLELTDEPDVFITFEQRITRQNLADPDPPRWLSVLLGTHPPIVERIGIAAAYQSGERTTPPRRRRSLRTRAGS